MIINLIEQKSNMNSYLKLRKALFALKGLSDTELKLVLKEIKQLLS